LQFVVVATETSESRRQFPRIQSVPGRTFLCVLSKFECDDGKYYYC